MNIDLDINSVDIRTAKDPGAVITEILRKNGFKMKQPIELTRRYLGRPNIITYRQDNV